MGVCETLLPDVVVSEAHQNARSYVHEFSKLTLDSLCKNFAWWAVTWMTSKNHKTVKIGGRRLPGIFSCLEAFSLHFSFKFSLVPGAVEERLVHTDTLPVN